MATNDEKLSHAINISDFETFQIKDSNNVSHAFVSTLEVRLKLLGKLKKATFYSRLRRLNSFSLKANPQQAKILKDKLKVGANIFYLMPRSKVKELVKKDCSTFVTERCALQGALSHSTSQPNDMVDKVAVNCEQEQIPYDVNSFMRFPHKGVCMESGMKLGKYGTIDKNPNSLHSTDYCLTDIPEFGEGRFNHSPITVCTDTPTPEYDLTTDNISDNTSKEFSDTNSEDELSTSRLECHPRNLQPPDNSHSLETETIPEETSSNKFNGTGVFYSDMVDGNATCQAGKPVETSERNMSGSLVGKKNECEVVSKIYGERECAKSTEDIEIDCTDYQSRQKYLQADVTCKEAPFIESQTAFEQDGIAVDEGGAIQALDTMKRGLKERLKHSAGSNEKYKMTNFYSEDLSKSLSQHKRLNHKSSANVDIDCTTGGSIKKRRLSVDTKTQHSTVADSPVTNNWLKECINIDSIKTVNATGSSKRVGGCGMTTDSIPVSSDIIEVLTKKRRVYGFDAALIPDETLIALSKFRKFWSKHLVAERPTAHLAPSTLKKILNRITQYFFYLSTILKKEPLLDDCENITRISSFIEYLIKERSVSHGTAGLIVQALLYVAKYMNKSHFTDDFRKVESVNKMRNLQAGLFRLYERGKKMADPENTKSKLKLVWTEILDVVRKVVNAFEHFSGGKIQEARLVHDLVLILFLVTVSPNRNLDHMRLEIVDLRWKRDVKIHELSHSDAESNYLVLLNDGRILLKDYVFKTASTYGSSCLELQDIGYLTEYLLIYVDKHRKKLLLSKQHPYLFMKMSGDPFSSSAEFSMYLGNAFEKYGSKYITCNDIRKALVTFVLDQQSTTPELKKSLASLMKHGERYQENVYYQRNFSRDKLEALTFLSQHTGKYLGLLNDGDDHATDRAEDEPNDEKESNPEVGSVVALVSAASTRKSPEIFLGKLLQYTNKRMKAVLGEMELVEGTSRCYRLKPGYSWTENTEALVWPVDVEFREKDQVYVLRSSLRDLHASVKS